MKSQPNGEWTYLETVVTDGNGRASYKVPEDKRLPQGIYPVKMVVRSVLYGASSDLVTQLWGFGGLWHCG